MADPNTNAVKTHKRSDDESVYRLSEQPCHASKERHERERRDRDAHDRDVTETSLKKAAMKVTGIASNAENM